MIVKLTSQIVYYKIVLINLSLQLNLLSYDNVKIVTKEGKIKENLELVKQDYRHLIDKANIENNRQAIEDCSKIFNKSTNKVINEIHKLRVN